MAYCNGLVRAAQRQRFQSRTLHCRKFAELEEKWSMNGAALWNLGKEQPHSNGIFTPAGGYILPMARPELTETFWTVEELRFE